MVRAAGSLSINGTISDGFISDPYTGLIALSNTPSGSLSFVAGADTQSANPLAVFKGSTANLSLLTSSMRPDGSTDGVGPSVVRTGTGDINLVAAGDVIFQAGTSVYTGGAVPANVYGPVELNGAGGSILQNFGGGGGAVRVSAGMDVVGSPVGSFNNGDNGNFSVTGWQLRQGNAQNPAQIGINFAAFDWNIGALGGGDVSISAGRNVMNVSAATADSLVSAANTLDGTTDVYGAGGGLSISAAGDIGSAQVFVADGAGTLAAGGGLTAVRTVPGNINVNQSPVGSSIALGDSQISVWARQDVQVDALYNPTVVSQLQGASSDVSGQYYTYGLGAAVDLSSTAGTVTLELNTSNGTMAVLVGAKPIAANGSAFLVAPPNLSVQSLQSDLNLMVGGSSPTTFLYPSPTGQLGLFAGRDILANGGITMSDSFLTQIPTAIAPQIQLSNAPNTLNGLAPLQAVIHADDPIPALITAGRDIVDLTLSIPKAADLVAGRDILNLQYRGQNTSPSDISLIAAGRDLIDNIGSGNFPGIQLGGQGSLDVATGRNLNLGFGNGIVTTGNLANANLPSPLGADLSLMVGYGTQGADLSGFEQKIITPSPTYQAQLTAYVEELTGTSGLTYAQAQGVFAMLSTPQQSAFIDQVLFNELLLSGRAANSGTGVGFTEGYTAIDALYPGSRQSSGGTAPYAGNLVLTSSQVYTLSGGNISILVPGGEIDVGLANPPANIPHKDPSQLGIVAEGAGNVNIYTQGDVNVNQSRIFTLGGGNILIWSTLGSIDAGNGSKSSLSVPPPIVLIAKDGTISLDYAGSLASGSGIRTIQTNPDVPPGNVDLDAPVGTVNAGDAGIGSAGNINIAAAHVVGVTNINFGGTSTGVPPEVSNLGASLSGASSVASSATSSAEGSVTSQANASNQVAPLSQSALSWLDVFVTGLGEENCKPDDLECLKRQKTATP